MVSVRAELLVSPECPHADEAEAVLRRSLAAEGVGSGVSRMTISSLDEAGSYGFLGSPTIRIDGRDVQPAEDSQEIGLACRLYHDESGGISGVPSEALVRAAIRARVAPPVTVRRPGVRDIPARTLRATFVWASHRGSLEALVRRLPPTAWLVRRFVAGETLAQVLPVLESLSAAGYRTTVDLLGESIRSADDAKAATQELLDTIDALAARRLDVNVSLKLTALGLDVDESVARANVARIAARAAQHGGFVRIDMEDHTRTDVTLRIAGELLARYGNVGTVLQAYLHRTARDVADANARHMRVRLCKGAYSEPADVAFPAKADVDANYLQLMERLLLEGTYPALATHDERLIEAAVAFCRSHAIPVERFEFQMLYGIRRDLQERLVADGWTVRLYVPFGREWYPYFMRRLAERPANLVFLLRNVLRDGRR